MDKRHWLHNVLLLEPERVQFNHVLRRGKGSLATTAHGHVKPFLGRRVLELGCGTGWLGEFWKISDYTGIDSLPFCEPFEQETRTLAIGNGMVEIGPEAFADTSERSFDTCVWNESIRTYSNDQFSSIITRLLDPGGHAIIIGPQSWWPSRLLSRQQDCDTVLNCEIPLHWFDFEGLALTHLEIIAALEDQGYSRREILATAAPHLGPQLLESLQQGTPIKLLRSQLNILNPEPNDFKYSILVLRKRTLHNRSNLGLRMAHPLTDAKADPVTPKTARQIVWHDAREMSVEGQAWRETVSTYDRLPAHMAKKVPRRLWMVSKCPAGFCVRFQTSSPEIWVTWKTITRWSPIMSASGLRGVDLYRRDAEGWRFMATGIPQPNSNTSVTNLIALDHPQKHEYLLYFPVSSFLQWLHVGLLAGCELSPGSSYSRRHEKPLCFYGTCFTQGLCTSRPGMAYPSIIGRWMEMPVINLGFSGTGKMEPVMAPLLADVDCAMYILDCIPNMSRQQVRQRFYPFVKALRALKPDVPILLVDNPFYTDAWFCDKTRSICETRSAGVAEGYSMMRSSGMQNIDLVPGHLLLGSDGEACVDNHATDLANMRAAEQIFPRVRRLIG